MADELTEPGGEHTLPEGPFVVGPPSRRRRLAAGGVALVVVLAMLARLWPDAPVSPTQVAAADDPETVTILAGTPASIDPAKHGDLGSARQDGLC